MVDQSLLSSKGMVGWIAYLVIQITEFIEINRQLPVA